MPDAEVEAALAHWAPRFIQNGVDYNDFVRTVQRIDTWDQWLPAWSRTADEQAELAQESDATGHLDTAGHAWRRAATDRHFGKFVWMVDLDLAAEAGRRSVEEMRAAHARLDPTAERLEVPVDGSTAYANLRRPRGADRSPYVVLIPGLDSTKEEFFYFEQGFLDRGIATVSLDGPGQGETGLTLPIRPDYEVGVTPLLDALPAAPTSTTTGSACAGSAWAATTRRGPPRSSPGCVRSRASADRSASATCGTTCRR